MVDGDEGDVEVAYVGEAVREVRAGEDGAGGSDADVVAVEFEGHEGVVQELDAGGEEVYAEGGFVVEEVVDFGADLLVDLEEVHGVGAGGRASLGSSRVGADHGEVSGQDLAVN